MVKKQAAALAPSPQRSWKSTGRRVQLAVKTSVRNASNKADFDGDDQTSSAVVHTIDEALSSFCYADDEVPTASSYIPTKKDDWLLDGDMLVVDDEVETELLLEELHADPMLELLEQLEKRKVAQQICDEEESLSEEKKEIDDEDEDDDEFGEFQSASKDEDETWSSAAAAASEEAPEPTQPQEETASKNDRSSDGTSPISLETDDLQCSGSQTLAKSELPQLAQSIITSPRVAAEETSSRTDEQHLDGIPVDLTCEAPSRDEPTTPLGQGSVLKLQRFERGVACEDASVIPISIRLPVDDLNSLEARFARRCQKEYYKLHQLASTATILSRSTSLSDFDLPGYFFTSTGIDDSIQCLESLPWYYILDDDTFDLDLWDNNITSRLCELDGALLHINQDQLLQVQPHQFSLQTANQVMHEFEQNLRLANMYWDRSNTAVTKASTGENDDDGGGLSGMRQSLLDMNAREDFRELERVLEELARVWTKERELMDRVDCYCVDTEAFLEEFQSIQQLIAELKDVSSTGDLQRLDCLAATRENADRIHGRFVQRLHQLARIETVRFCRLVTGWTNYGRLIVSLGELIPVLHDSTDVASLWAENIVATLCYEVNRSLTVALLESDDLNASSYRQELRKLSREVDAPWGDSPRLRTLTHNLVTIRFNFESSEGHLPRVFDGTLQSVFDVLDVFCQLIEFHRRRPLSGPESIGNELSTRSGNIWTACSNVLAQCLEEYLNFSSRRKLFDENQNDDKLWLSDLEHLNRVFSLAQGFLSIKEDFVDLCAQSASVEETDFEDSNLMGLVADISRRHLRAVHVESMNTVGRCLASESWTLRSFDVKTESEHDSDVSLEELIRMASTQMTVRIEEGTIGSQEPPKNRFLQALKGKIQAELPVEDNTRTSPACVSDLLLQSVQPIQHGTALAPEAVTRVILHWFSRLIAIMRYLPLIHDDVASVFTNLSDLYLTTVLRICAGGGKTERVLLGSDMPSAFITPQINIPLPTNTLVQNNSTAASLLSSFRSARQNQSASVNRAPKVVLPSNMNAEICSPIPQDCKKLDRLANFIHRGQRSLSAIVNLDMVDSWLKDPHTIDTHEEKACAVAQLLSRQEGAITGCVVLAVMLHVMNSDAISILGSSRAENFRAYSTEVLEIVPALCDAARRVACVRAIDGRDLIKEIVSVGSGWYESKLHSHCNDYVEDLCDRCSLLWGYLKVSGKLSNELLRTLWECVVSAAYQSLAEGFARVPQCSAEGRALMALDLASLASGISGASVFDRLQQSLLVDAPPPVEPQCNRLYVETYIKVFYFPKDDIFSWIVENRDKYKINHVLALVVSSVVAAASYDDTVSIPELLEDTKRIYKGDSIVKEQDELSRENHKPCLPQTA